MLAVPRRRNRCMYIISNVCDFPGVIFCPMASAPGGSRGIRHLTSQFECQANNVKGTNISKGCKMAAEWRAFLTSPEDTPTFRLCSGANVPKLLCTVLVKCLGSLVSSYVVFWHYAAVRNHLRPYYWRECKLCGSSYIFPHHHNVSFFFFFIF